MVANRLLENRFELLNFADPQIRDHQFPELVIVRSPHTGTRFQLQDTRTITMTVVSC